MSNYNKSTNFAVKDTLTSGDPDKVVSGAEIDNEFNAVASAVSTKIDKVTSATSGNVPTLTSSGSIEDSGVGRNVLSPTGAIVAFSTSSAPSGWLECDGSEVGRAIYPNLFNVIGTNFGSGDGSTTFGLPDLRGEFVRGWDNNRGIDSGRSFGTNQDDEIRSHTHDYIGHTTADADSSGVGNKADNETTRTTDPTGGDETRPRNIALMYIIKT